MFAWLRTKSPFVGTVMFRGALPPRPEDFEHLQNHDLAVERESPLNDVFPGMRWILHLRHPNWGEALLGCPRDQTAWRSPRVAIEYAVELTPQEKELLLPCQSSLVLQIDNRGGNALREHKLALRFLHAVMNDDGVAASDCGAQRYWSRDALDEELAHDADLDIDQLYALHLVTHDGEPTWLHSHGLAAVGAFDFDVLRPTADLCTRGGDLLRALAFAALEGQVAVSTPRFRLGDPGPVARFVKAADFQRLASPEDAALRSTEGHLERRTVLCEPARGVLSRLFSRVKPLGFLSRPLPEHLVCDFSTEATELMARRARGTYAHFCRLVEELAEFQFPALVKLGYPIDGGHPLDREHLWFSVNSCCEDLIDATLVNQPFSIARMNEGDRGRHSVDLLTDWTILTPAGPLSPRSLHPIRALRNSRENLRGESASQGSLP